MKTSKSDKKSKVSSKNKDAVKNINARSIKSRPSENDIREKAMDIYHQRLERGEHGTAEKDWLEAEAYFMESED